MSTVQAEYDRLSRILVRLEYPIKTAPPATAKQLASIAAVTGIQVDDSLQQLWRISNGSRRNYWFVHGDDEDCTPYLFLSIKEALSNWRLFAPYDENMYATWYDDESWGKRDPRIQRHLLRHAKWLGFAEFNGGSDLLQFDADPTAKGEHGQLILYSHDPDGVFWVAPSFLSFFRKSNDLLESLSNDPKFLAEKLGISHSCRFTEGDLWKAASRRNVEFDFDGIRVTWPESGKGNAGQFEMRAHPSDPLSNRYGVVDGPFTLSINYGQLVFTDDGLDFAFGTIGRGDHIVVAGYSEIYVNGQLREPQTDE